MYDRTGRRERDEDHRPAPSREPDGLRPSSILALQRTAGNRAVTRAVTRTTATLARKRFTDANVRAKADEVARTDSRGGDLQNYVEAKTRLRAEEIHVDTGRTDAQANYFQAEHDVEDAWNEYQRLGATAVAPSGVNWALLEDGLSIEECRQARAISKLRGFSAVGEGFMTSANMIGTNFRVGAGNPQHAQLNARLDYWASEGFGNAGQEATDISALNRIFGINAPQDARNYRAELVNAYRSLAGSQTAVGQQLAALLAQPSFTLTLQDARHGNANVVKNVDLKLIVAPGIPSQFLSPWEQGMTLDQSIDSPAALPAVLMWDPHAHFAFYKPRTPADATKADNDPTRRGTAETMDPWVSLAHELGHFQDFLSRPMEFSQALQGGNIALIEQWNLPREQAIVRQDLHKEPRAYYQDFVGGANAGKLTQA